MSTLDAPNCTAVLYDYWDARDEAAVRAYIRCKPHLVMCDTTHLLYKQPSSGVAAHELSALSDNGEKIPR